MPRFDVHRARGRRGYLLNVQSDHLETLPTRVVVPLLSPEPDFPRIAELTPMVTVEGESLAMMTHYLTAVSRRELGRVVTNLCAERDSITRALDILLTGF